MNDVTQNFVIEAEIDEDVASRYSLQSNEHRSERNILLFETTTSSAGIRRTLRKLFN
jgi:hypothetical protein